MHIVEYLVISSRTYNLKSLTVYKSTNLPQPIPVTYKKSIVKKEKCDILKHNIMFVIMLYHTFHFMKLDSNNKLKIM